MAERAKELKSLRTIQKKHMIRGIAYINDLEAYVKELEEKIEVLEEVIDVLQLKDSDFE